MTETDMRKRDTIVLVFLAAFAMVTAGALRVGGSTRQKVMMCASSFRKIGAAVSVYCDTYDGKMPTMDGGSYSTTPNSTFVKAFWLLSTYDVTTSKQTWYNEGCLFKIGAIHDGTMFYCPTTPGAMSEYYSYSNPAPWGSNLQQQSPNNPGNGNVWLRMTKGNIYWPQSKVLATSADISRLGDNANLRYKVGYPMPVNKLSEMDTARAMIVDNQGLKDADGTYKVNALFGDGHVVFQPVPQYQGKWICPYNGGRPSDAIPAEWYSDGTTITTTQTMMCYYMYQFQP
jgi:prepilin-type processing-associated H-X9-DG protein